MAYLMVFNLHHRWYAIYTVIGTDDNGCTDSDQLIIQVNALPLIDAGSDQVVCDGNAVILFSNASGSLNWSHRIKMESLLFRLSVRIYMLFR